MKVVVDMDADTRRSGALLGIGGWPVTAVLWTVAMATSFGFGLSVAAVGPFAGHWPPAYGVVTAVLMAVVWARHVRPGERQDRTSRADGGTTDGGTTDGGTTGRSRPDGRPVTPGESGRALFDGRDGNGSPDRDGPPERDDSPDGDDWRDGLTDEQAAFVETVSAALYAGTVDELDPAEWDVDVSEEDLERLAERQHRR